MPDICMCKENNCPKRLECYRFMAIPTPYRQSYFVELKYDENGCELYWPINYEDANKQIKKEQ